MVELAPIYRQQLETLSETIQQHEPESLDTNIYKYEPDQYCVGTLEYFKNLSHGGITLLSENEQEKYKKEAITEAEYYIARFIARTTLQLFEDFNQEPSVNERYFSLESRIKDKRIKKSFYSDLHTLRHNLGHRSEPYPDEIIQHGKEKGLHYLLEYLTPSDSPMLRRYAWTEASDVMDIRYDEDRNEWYGQMETNIPGVFLESIYREDSENPKLLLIIKPHGENEEPRFA